MLYYNQVPSQLDYVNTMALPKRHENHLPTLLALTLLAPLPELLPEPKDTRANVNGDLMQLPLVVLEMWLLEGGSSTTGDAPAAMSLAAVSWSPCIRARARTLRSSWASAMVSSKSDGVT